MVSAKLLKRWSVVLAAFGVAAFTMSELSWLSRVGGMILSIAAGLMLHMAASAVLRNEQSRRTQLGLLARMTRELSQRAEAPQRSEEEWLNPR